MRAAAALVVFGLTLVAGAPQNIQRIIGGEVTSIERYPFMVAMLYTWNLFTYHQFCGGAVLNSRAVLTAAHCCGDGSWPSVFRARVGSTMAHSGGVVYHFSHIFIHPDFIQASTGSDIAILHTATVIVFNELVQPMIVPGRSYELPVNDSLIAIGWGNTEQSGVQSERLREVEVRYVKPAICRERYGNIFDITSDMLCSGWLDVGGRDQCQGDSGGPLVHNGRVVVGVSSWGSGCADPWYPGVNARVSSFTEWIQKNA